MAPPGMTPRLRSLTEAEWPAGCSERPFSKAAASEEARRTLRYVGVSERRENAAGGLCQQPASRSYILSGYPHKTDEIRQRAVIDQPGALVCDYHEEYAYIQGWWDVVVGG